MSCPYMRHSLQKLMQLIISLQNQVIKHNKSLAEHGIIVCFPDDISFGIITKDPSVGHRFLIYMKKFL